MQWLFQSKYPDERCEGRHNVAVAVAYEAYRVVPVEIEMEEVHKRKKVSDVE